METIIDDLGIEERFEGFGPPDPKAGEDVIAEGEQVLPQAPVARKVRRRATTRKISNRKAAKRCGIGIEHVGRVISGIRGCSLETAARIAWGKGWSLDTLWRVIQENVEARRALNLPVHNFRTLKPKPKEAQDHAQEA